MFLDPEASQENLKRPGEGSQETPKETPKGGPKIGQKVVKKWTQKWSNKQISMLKKSLRPGPLKITKIDRKKIRMVKLGYVFWAFLGTVLGTHFGTRSAKEGARWAQESHQELQRDKQLPLKNLKKP